MILALEGGDAAGKHTQATLLVEWFQHLNVEASVLDFPHYQTAVGKFILSNLKGEWAAVNKDCPPNWAGSLSQDHNAIVLQALMTVNRYELAQELLERSSGPRVLVLDRYWASGVVYGEADGLDREFLIRIHQLLPQPHLWVYLDVGLEERIRRRPERRDRYERDSGMQLRVAENYHRLFREMHGKNGVPWHILDANGTIDETTNKLQLLARNHILTEIKSRG